MLSYLSHYLKFQWNNLCNFLWMGNSLAKLMYIYICYAHEVICWVFSSPSLLTCLRRRGLSPYLVQTPLAVSVPSTDRDEPGWRSCPGSSGDAAPQPGFGLGGIRDDQEATRRLSHMSPGSAWMLLEGKAVVFILMRDDTIGCSTGLQRSADQLPCSSTSKRASVSLTFILPSSPVCISLRDYF